MQQSNPELFEQLRGQAQSAVNQHRAQNQPENEDPKAGQSLTVISFDKFPEHDVEFCIVSLHVSLSLKLGSKFVSVDEMLKCDHSNESYCLW